MGQEETIVQVRPRRASGEPKRGWWAVLVARSREMLLLRAPLQHPADLGYVVFALGDTMLERYWFGRWYNIFSLYGPDGRLKGWYANICTPISFDGRTIRYTDLELDLWVWPEGRYLVLDEEEFEACVVRHMPPAVVQKARSALDELLSDLTAGGRLFREAFPKGERPEDGENGTQRALASL
ncbi:MAG: DUF402 domain-containing protein [Chloroflexia bacterium]